METEAPQSCEICLVKKGGDKFYARLESIVIKNREHDLRQFRVAVSDITERKASEDELASYRNHLAELVEKRTAELSVLNKELKNKMDQEKKNELFLEESEKRYEKLFNSVTDSIIIFDSQTRIFIDINKAASKLYGYTKKEFLQLTQNNISAEPEISEISIKKIITGGKINIPVRYHKKKDGTVFPVEITPGSFKIKNKTMIFGIVRDITERLKNEKNVQRAEDRLRFLARRLIDTREDECKRISLELHDAMGQALTAIGFNISRLRNDISDSCQELLDDTVSIVDNMSTQVRNLSLDLRPSMLDDLGLIPTLRWFLNSFTRRTKIKTNLEAVEFDEYRNEDLEITIYRIVQESLNNVAKHAEAKNVVISLKREITRITGFIQDDGKGFDINKIFKRIGEKHIGLLSMKERISILGGTFKIQSGNGKGTRINIEIPC
ncbi:MAG: PAS domain S-box protein [Deltaproteobacteria bacterium]|nr:PAS domain S-box protein [Candidatus Desulfobacula maris]